MCTNVCTKPFFFQADISAESVNICRISADSICDVCVWVRVRGVCGGGRKMGTLEEDYHEVTNRF